MVDNFANSNQDMGNESSPDYKAYRDVKINPGTMRPPITKSFVSLFENANTTDASRLGAGYMVTGDVATLPYTVVPIITQSALTSSIAINPYNIVTWDGTLVIRPDQDIWTNVSSATTYLP